MSDPIPYRGGLSRLSQRAVRTIDVDLSAAQVRRSRIANTADSAAEKIDQLTYVTGVGLTSIGKIGAVVSQIEQQHPELSGRLTQFADLHANITAEILEDARREMRRL